MRKVLKTVCFSMAIMFTSHVGAQTILEADAQTNAINKKSVETNGFWSNWFISAGGGIQTYFGDNDNKADFGKRITPAVDFSIGKWFTPGMGLRLAYSGLTAKGASYENGAYATGKKNNKGLYEQKWDMMYLHGDIMFNLTDMFCGYKERVYSAIPYIGFGWVHSYDRPRNNEFAANVGFINRFRLSRAWDFNLEARAMMTKDNFDGQVGGKKYDGMVSVLAGFTYKLPQRGWRHAGTRTVSTGISMEEMNRIQAMLRDQQDRNRQLENDLMAERNKKPEVVTEKQFSLAPRIIIFPIGKSTISKEERVNIGYVAKAMKNTDKVYTICGYADEGTGSAATNERLSKQRAEAVYDILVNEFNVPAAQLKTESKGGVPNMFYDDAKLSRAVIIE